jgi:hypothetical protein
MRRETIPILLLLFLLAACGAPTAELPPPVPATTNPPAAQPEAESQPQVAASIPEPDSEPEPGAPEAAPLPEMTYRGDDLVATDPALINFESGRPQLVEFFRFT